jgi:hypothetical protein
MKLTILLPFLIFVINFSFSQEKTDPTSINSSSEEEFAMSKSDLIGTWRACGDVDWDENADTLKFQHPTPNCKDFECGEHNWSFRESGSIDFVFTNGCNSGFHSVSKSPKRWIFIEKQNRIKFITNDGFVEQFDVLRLDEKLVLVRL